MSYTTQKSCFYRKAIKSTDELFFPKIRNKVSVTKTKNATLFQKSFFITSISLLLCSVMFFMACQKDKFETEIKQEVPKALLSATTREGNPFTDSRIHLVDGMLKFDDYKAFNDTHEALKELASNSELNNATLIETGYNPDTDLDEELAVIPSHPVLQAFAHRFGLRSEEQKEEVAFKAHLQTEAKIEDFRGSPVYSPILQSMLNDKREVKIGTFILKFIDENHTALIYNNNMEVLSRVRNTEVGRLRDGFDLYIIDLLDPTKTMDELFTGSEEAGTRELTGICDVKFDANFVSGNIYSFENQSIGKACLLNTYEWDFGDGTPTFIGNGNPPNHNFNTNKYPYTVTLTKICGGQCEGVKHTFVINDKNDPCAGLADIDFFVTKPLGGNNVTFEIPGLKTTGMTATIDFGNGSPIGTVSNLVPSSFVHLYGFSNSPVSLIAVLTVTIPGCTPVVISKQLSVSCGHYYAKTTRNHDGYFGGRLWRLTGVVWSQNNKIIRDLGASSQVYRFGSNEIFKYAKNATTLDVDVQGTVLNATFDGAGNITCSDVTIPSIVIPSSGPASYIARRPGNTPIGLRFEEAALFSDHHATVGTGVSALTLKVEKLFLTDF